MTAFLIGLVLGAIASALVIRNNAAKAASVEQKAKSLVDILKGR